jgi:hypothetical protein
MTKKIISQMICVSVRRLNQLYGDGTLPNSLNPSKVVPAYVRFIRKSPALAEAQLRRAIAKARLDELRALQEEDKLIAKDVPLKWLHGHVTEAKDAFWGLPRRMAEALAVETDSKIIEVTLQEEIRRILTDLADGKVKFE